MRLPGGIYYGWAIALFASMVAFSSGPGQSFVFSVFVDPIIEETGFSRSAVSTLYSAGSGISAVMVSVVSRMADRFGPGLLLLATLPVLAIVVISRARPVQVVV